MKAQKKNSKNFYYKNGRVEINGDQNNKWLIRAMYIHLIWQCIRLIASGTLTGCLLHWFVGK